MSGEVSPNHCLLSTVYLYSRFAQVPNARLGHVQASLTAALALRICPTVYFTIFLSSFVCRAKPVLSSNTSHLKGAKPRPRTSCLSVPTATPLSKKMPRSARIVVATPILAGKKAQNLPTSKRRITMKFWRMNSATRRKRRTRLLLRPPLLLRSRLSPPWLLFRIAKRIDD